MNNLFTIIIPAHNRPERLKRLLDYYVSFNCRVIVSDSSDIAFKYLESYREKVIYVHYPKMHLAEKLSMIFDKISTPYVVMCADDDYIFPSSIEKIASYLKNHHEYKSGQGIFTRYYPLDNNSIYLEYPQMLNNSLNDDDSGERVLHLMSAYYQFYYAVFEKQLFVESISSTIEDGCCKLQNLCLLELYLSIYGAIHSKHIILPILYCMREHIPGSAGSYIPNIDYLIKNSLKSDEIAFMKNKLSSLISEDTSKGRFTIEKALTIYLFSCNKKRNILERVIRKIDYHIFSNFILKKFHQYLIKKNIENYCVMNHNINIVKKNIMDNFDAVYKHNLR